MSDTPATHERGESAADSPAVGSTVVTPKKKPKAGDVLRHLRKPRVLTMLALGFSSGLPFLLTAGTFGYWLRDEGTTLKAIGFLSWVGLAYTFKFLWSPVVDRADVPILGKIFGRRRGWMVLTQLIIAAGLIAMAIIRPDGGLAAIGTAALVVAFASATQDIVIDAWRIEAAEDSEELGLLSAAYQLGYRIAIIVSDALILIIANHLGWPFSYGVMAVLMSVGLFASFRALEPTRTERAAQAQTGVTAAPLWSARGFADAIVGPFMEFFRVYGWMALVMFLFITTYRLPEFMMGPMATPFYHDLGLSKDVVGAVRGSFGLAGSFTGIALGGLIMAQVGFMRGLLVGGILQALAVASFSILAVFGGNPTLFGLVMFFDNMGVAACGVALVTYMSTLTSIGYTATQYALLSSAYAFLGKFLKGFSGAIVEGLEGAGRTLMEAYGVFFVLCGAIEIPALILLIFVARAHMRRLNKLEAAAP